jgi:thiamine-monophosphate kinase
MGATPRHCLLALTLREGLDGGLVDGVLDGMESLARQHRVAVVGGNLSAAPCLTLTVTALGELYGPGLTRAGGKPGDRLMVTGQVGSAALGLHLLRSGRRDLDAEESDLVERHLAPAPRVAAGEALRSMATAGIDISDGLAQDAGHLARASRCGVRIHLDRLPLSDAYERLTADLDDPWAPALAGGEDYELLLAVPQAMVATATMTAAGVGTPLHEIGELTLGEGVEVVGADGLARPAPAGWRHF